MYIIGMNGNLGRESHDPSVFLLNDNELIFAAEEERYNRIKHSNGKVPIYALKACLDRFNLKISDIDVIAFPQNTWGDLFEERLRATLTHWFGMCPPISFYNHHLCHAMSAYIASGFTERTLVYSIDGSGDSISTSMYIGERGQCKLMDKTTFPNSMGLFYSLFTQYLGFLKNNDEYKVMSLAAYGNKEFEISDVFHLENGKFSLDSKLLSSTISKLKYPLCPTKQEPFYDASEFSKICTRRLPFEDITSTHKDLAASFQYAFEQTNIQLINDAMKKYKCKNLCLSGGSALNCIMVGKVLDSVAPDRFYIPPVCDDAGTALGAAYCEARCRGILPKPISHAYFGDSFSNEDIFAVLAECKVRRDYVSDLPKAISDDIQKGNVIAVFNGRMEVGPRALGNRSILADARQSNMRDRLNHIKNRLSFQPFAVVVLDEHRNDFFECGKYHSPFMNVAFHAKRINEIPAAVHADSTTRIQTITEENGLIFEILEKFFCDTNIPLLINTSFNLKGQPIVRTPQDALAAFFSSGIDALYLNNYVIRKDNYESLA